MLLQQARRQGVWREKAPGTGLITCLERTANRQTAKRVDQFILRPAIQARQLLDTRDDSCLLVYLTHNGVPWRLARFHAATWLSPEVSVPAQAQQRVATLVQNGRKGTKPKRTVGRLALCCILSQERFAHTRRRLYA